MCRVTLHARWRGNPPRLGDYLMARRARGGYQIVDIKPGSAPYDLRFVVERVPRAEAERAGYHEWVWDRRARRRLPA